MRTHFFWLLPVLLLIVGCAPLATQETSPPPNYRCPITATRTPPPDAPTFMPGSGGDATPRQVDPHVELCVSAQAVTVGDTLTITALPVDLGLPVYTLLTSSDGDTPATQLARLDYNGVVQDSADSARFTLEGASGGMYEASFTLRATQAGAAVVFVHVSGEIHYGYPGPATWGGGESVVIPITVRDTP